VGREVPAELRAVLDRAPDPAEVKIPVDLPKGHPEREHAIGRLAAATLARLAADLTAAEWVGMSDWNQMNQVVWPQLNEYHRRLAEAGVGKTGGQT
jgi:hypothetical protein